MQVLSGRSITLCGVEIREETLLSIVEAAHSGNLLLRVATEGGNPAGEPAARRLVVVKTLARPDES
jgi:hypothetical protein